MSADLTPFDFQGQSVRTLLIDDAPWFVARDVCAVLGISNGRDALNRVDEDGVATTDLIDNLGRKQSASIVNEPGLYELIFQSRKPEAKAFRRWVTAEVLPAIRKTGSYKAGLTPEEQMALGLVAAHELLAVRDKQIAQLEPKAKTFDVFLSSTGDYSVNEAAKSLSRDHDILTGERRLFQFMQRIGWIYRDGKGKPIPYQAQVDNGRLVAKPQFHYHPETGEVVADPPQIRVTAKGLEALHQKYMQAAS